MQFATTVTASLLLSLSPAPIDARPLTLNQLIKAHTLARGGAERLNAVKTLRLDVRIEEPEINAYGRWYGRADGRMRVDIFAHSRCQRAWSEGIDEKGAWAWPGDAAAPIEESAAGRAALQHGIEFNLFSLGRYQRRGHKLRLLGLQDVADSKLYTIQITFADGFETYRYIDPKNYMIVASRDFRAFHPDVDAKKKWIETRYFDFKRRDGIIDADATENWNLSSRKVIGRGRTIRRDYNPVVTNAMLSRNAVPPPYCSNGATPD